MELLGIWDTLKVSPSFGVRCFGPLKILQYVGLKTWTFYNAGLFVKDTVAICLTCLAKKI